MYTDNIFKRLQQIKEKSESNKTLTSVDFTPNNSDIIGVARQAAPTAYSVDDEIAKKYNKYGLTWTPSNYYSGKLDIELANSQSNWSKLGNALAQTVVSEILLGTGVAISDLFDVIGQAIHVSDYNYSNPLTDKLIEWQDTFRNEVVPIYSKPNSGFGEGTDFGWWMQNIPSIASSLTLLIPSTAVSKGILAGVKGLSSATKLGKRWETINEATRRAISGGSEIALNAGISRTLENYQEARSVYNEVVPSYKLELDKKVKDGTYNEFLNHNAELLKGVDTSNTLEVAKAIGRTAADKTFTLDYVNSVFDVIQLLALRNIKFNAFAKSPKTVAGRRYDINAKKYAGQYKTKEELKELINNKKTFDKLKDKFGDAAYYIGTTGLAQASEGVEEAINYIASQEGLYLADTILNMGANTTTFTERFDDYIRNPVLWENAFWGLIGGVTFNVVGNGLSEAKRESNRKKLEKELQSKANVTTGENTAMVDLLSEYMETADNKRINASIDSRIATEAEFYNKMTALNTRNEDPFTPGRIIESEEEKAVAREQLLQERRQTLILNAMDSGTIDMLEAYLTDRNVQQAMIDAGIVTKEDVSKIQQEDLTEIDRLRDRYNFYKKHTSKVAKELKKTSNITVPTEYLQIITRDNISHELTKERFEKMKARVEKDTTVLTGNLASSLDPTIDYKGIVKLQVLTTQLGQLQAQLDRLSSDGNSLSSFFGQEQINNIKKEIETLKETIYNNSELTGTNISNLLAAIEGSYATKVDDTGNFVEDNNNEKSKSFRQALINKDLEFFKNLDNRLINISEEDLTDYQNHVNKIVAALGDKSKLNIFNISKELGTNYALIAALEHNINIINSKIKRTDEEILDRAKDIHNVINNIRTAKIEQSYEIIKELADTYGSDQIAKYIEAKFRDPKNVPDIPNITEEDKKRLDTALDVLNLTSKLNENVLTNILTILKTYDDIKAAQEKSSSKSQKPKSSGQPAPAMGNAQQGRTTPNQHSNATTEPNSNQTTPNPQQPQSFATSIGIDLNVNNHVSPEVVYTTRKTANGQIIVVFDNISINTNYFNNNTLFVKEEGVSLMDDNFIIKSNPIFDVNGTLITPGVLAVANEENIAKANANSQEEDADTQLSSTGGVDTNPITPTPIPTPAPIPSPVPVDSDDNLTPIIDEDAEINTSYVTDDDVSDEEYEEFKIKTNITKECLTILFELGEKQQSVTDETLEEIKTVLTDKFNKDGNPRIQEVINNEVNKLKDNAIEFDLYKPIAKAIEGLRQAELSERDINLKEKALTTFNKAIDELIETNKTLLGFESIDGKVYINIETLLNFCNTVSNNTVVASILYEQMLAYLTASSKYIVVDANPKAALRNLRLSKEHREALELTDSHSINFDGFCNRVAIKEDKSNAIEAINNLNIGDTITYRREHNHIVFYKNSVQIGYIPIPINYKPGTDHIMQINDGWITDIKVVNGSIESEFQSLLIDIITNPNKDSNVTELYETILQYAYETDFKKKQTLFETFVNNSVYKQIVKDGYTSDDNIDDNTDPDLIRLEGLAKLWKYVKDVAYNGDDVELIIESKLQAIDNRALSVKSWFSNKILPGFTFANALSVNEEGSLIVSDITEGSRIQVAEEQASVPKKALGSRYKYANGKIKPDTVKIGVSVNKTVHISGNPKTENTALIERGQIDSGNTFVLLLNRNGIHDVVHAFPQKPSSPLLSRSVKPILTAIKHELTRLFENLTIDDNTDKQIQFDETTKFLNALFGKTSDFRGKVFNDRKGLFAPIKGILSVRSLIEYTKTVGWEINAGDNASYIIRKESDSIIIMNSSTNDIVTLDEMLSGIFAGNCYFNIGKSFINIDNGKSSSNPFYSIDEKGKFTVTIGTFKKQYQSYNDFILNEGLVTLATHPNNDGFGNHYRFGEDGGAIQTIKVKHTIEADYTSPVEESNETAETPVNDTESSTVETTNTNAVTPETIITAINNNRDNEGYGIAKLLFDSFASRNIKGFDYLSQTLFNNLPNIYKELFPKNVIFVNETINAYAYANVKGHAVVLDNTSKTKIPAGYIVVGKEWFDELVNSSTAGRKEAIRKLIHENIHLILSNPNNAHYIEDIRKIFNEFAKSNKDPNAARYLFNHPDHKDRYYNKDGTINTEGLEDFLIESLTSGVLANALNNIKSTDGKEHKTLFSKIIDFLLKLFDWSGVTEVKQGSLYEEELSIINSLFGDGINVVEDKNDTSTPEPVQSDNQTETPPSDNNITDVTNNNIATFNPEYNDLSYKISEEEEQEMQRIKDKAIADGTFMKAPNGKPTKLNERRWLRVRTKAFKDWFGDWEKVARSSKYRKSKYTPNSITSATYQGITVGPALFDADMAPDGGKRIIFLGDKYIGEIPTFESEDRIRMGGSIGAATEIIEEYRGKGYGKKAHLALANIAKAEGKVLYSDSSNSDVENALWKSLVKEGIAEVVSEKPKEGYWNHTTYRIINNNLPQADDIDPGDRGVSKVVDENGEPLVVYHGDNFEFNESNRDGATFKQIYASNKPWGKHKKDYPIFLNLRNPRVEEWGFTDDFSQEYENVEKEVINKGYDGAIGYYEKNKSKEPYSDNIREFYVISQNQIKLAEDKDFKSKDDSNDDIYSDDFTEFTDLNDDFNDFDLPPDDIPASLIKEIATPTNAVSNISNFVNNFSVSDQPKIIRRINNGEISIICN